MGRNSDTPGLFKTRTIRHNDPDEFAPLRGRHVCRSPSGRWRPRHDFDRDGICYFCRADREKPPASAFLPKSEQGTVVWVAVMDELTCTACQEEHGRGRLKVPHLFCTNENGCRCRLESV